MNSVFKILNLSYFIEHQRVGEDKTPQDCVICSENVAYDNISNTLKFAATSRMTCSENIAYDTTVKHENESSMRSTHTSHIAVYDEVHFEKN